jgi:hypothetical protein
MSQTQHPAAEHHPNAAAHHSAAEHHHQAAHHYKNGNHDEAKEHAASAHEQRRRMSTPALHINILASNW